MVFYKLLLVDDEEDVRMSIEKEIDWNTLGFEIVGSVNNGEEALELAEATHVDVVMTDIKMPLMDGLTFCAKLKENHKNIKIVICTEFDEFEFSREAIRLGVAEYLLKPVEKKDFKKVFCKIKEKLDEEKKEKQKIEKLDIYYKKSLPMIQEQFLTGMIEGKMQKELTDMMYCICEMDLLAPYYCVAVLSEGFDASEKDFQTGQMFKLSFMNLTREYLKENITSHSFIYLNQVIVIAQLQEAEEVQKFMNHINKVCKMGSRMLGINVDAGIGNIYSQISEIAVSYKEAKTALDYRILGIENNQMIDIRDVETNARNVFSKEIQGVSNVIHTMKFGTEDELNTAIDELIQELSAEHQVTILQYQFVLIELVMEILKLLRSYQLDMTNIDGRNILLYQEIYTLYSLRELNAWMKTMCFNIQGMLSKKRVYSTKVMLEKVKEYIEQNYSISTLSVEDICKYLNISATYVSAIFKKELGMGFVSYLTKVRLEHAVELLETTEEKSYIIAEKVGYKEANYFSYVFKKQYGVSPLKYRKNQTKKED